MTLGTGRSLWVTGGGSGIGRAAARAAARSGWAVAVSGRRKEALESVVNEITNDGGTAVALPLDARDRTAVVTTTQSLLDLFGSLDGLVLSTGRNARRRRWGDQDMADFEDIVATNLTATATVLDAALPHLKASNGTIVVVSSYAGWSHQQNAGVAYSASKTALASLVRTVNQEAGSSVRACHLCPGDVATEFLDQRPQVPSAAARAEMLKPDDVARSIQFVLDSPNHVRFDEVVITPVSQNLPKE